LSSLEVFLSVARLELAKGGKSRQIEWRIHVPLARIRPSEILEMVAVGRRKPDVESHRHDLGAF
jgi:hypothetical protein